MAEILRTARRRRSYLHPHIEARSAADKGRGLFATGPIAAGEVTWRRHRLGYPLELTTDELFALPPGDRNRLYRYVFQIGPALWAGGDPDAHDPAFLTNHSCNPSTWRINDTTLVARFDLNRGDELTYDYATTETDPGWSMRCLCGSLICRKTVTGLDYRQPWFWSTYEGHTHSYVARLLTRST